MRNGYRSIGLILLALLPLASADAFWSRFSNQFKIHQEITSTALRGKDGKKNYSFSGADYAFSETAIKAINQMHSIADSDPYDRRDHFDSEALVDSLMLLYNRRLQLMTALADSPNQSAAWTLLGLMLHQIQDFYSHSTWLQSGHTGIADLGSVANIDFLKSSSTIGTVCNPDGASLVTPVTAVTTGYYNVALPPGKCQHGNPARMFAVCTAPPEHPVPPDGINHDAPCFSNSADNDLFAKAKDFAGQETVKFVQEIVAELATAHNGPGFCALLGLDQGQPVCGNNYVSVQGTVGLCIDTSPDGHVTGDTLYQVAPLLSPSGQIIPVAGAIVSTSLDQTTAITDASGQFALTTNTPALNRPAPTPVFTISVSAAGFSSISTTYPWGAHPINQQLCVGYAPAKVTGTYSVQLQQTPLTNPPILVTDTGTFSGSIGSLAGTVTWSVDSLAVHSPIFGSNYFSYPSSSVVRSGVSYPTFGLISVGPRACCSSDNTIGAAAPANNGSFICSNIVWGSGPMARMAGSTSKGIGVVLEYGSLRPDGAGYTTSTTGVCMLTVE